MVKPQTMNIMSLDAAYGAGTMQELHHANEDNDYGHGQGNAGAMQLEQVPQRAPEAGFSKLAAGPGGPAPPGRHVVAQYPPPPPAPHGPPGVPRPPPPGLPPLPRMPPQGPPPHQPHQPHHQQGPPHQQHLAQQPLPFHAQRLDDRFRKQGVAAAPPGGQPVATVKEKGSFFEQYKVLIIVMIVVICLVLGVLVAVLVTHAKKQKALSGGGVDAHAFDGLMHGGAPTMDFGALAGGALGNVPQFVGGGGGGVDFGGHMSSLPTRAWNESASAFLRR